MSKIMNIQMKKKTIFFGSMLCSIFTIMTLVSSTIQLKNGVISDTNLHIILRFIICLIGILFWITFSSVKFKKPLITIICQYVLSMSLIWALIFIIGYFVELAPSAYRDIFLNYTIPFIIISAIISYSKKHTRKKKS